MISKAEIIKPSSSPKNQQLIDLKERPLQEPLQLQPPPSILKLGKFATFDCEWYRDDLKENTGRGIAGYIYIFSLAGSQGKELKLHINDYPDKKTFMSKILDTMENYDTLAGYGIFSDKNFVSDIEHIANNCNEIGVFDRLVNIGSKVKFLDASKILNEYVERQY